MRELVVISGKGGTGKTSVTASFASLADRAVLVDCDVDAADLHLVLAPQVRWREEFSAGSRARVDDRRCTGCGRCVALCRFEALDLVSGARRELPVARVDPIACEGCGVCVDCCPVAAVSLEPTISGQWFISDTRCGPLVHAQLAVAAENSGKLVTQLRGVAQRVATEQQRETILCDGSPGIGCPVIASLTGANLVLIVVEPTTAGLHDFARVAQLVQQLGVPAVMAINKADLNPEVANDLEECGQHQGIAVVGHIPYDPAVTAAQIAGKAVVEVSDGPAACAIRQLWEQIRDRLRGSVPTPAGRLVTFTIPSEEIAHDWP